MKAYRITDGRHRPFDGTGASLRGGRWNSPDRKVIYAAQSLAVARLEQLVRMPTGYIPQSQIWIEIDIPEDIVIAVLDEAGVPGWNVENAIASRIAGDAWYDSQRSLCLSVPSVPAFGERNILINQSHPDFARLKASAPQPLIWDERLFQR